MRVVAALVVAVAVTVSACQHDARLTREREGLGGGAPVVQGPEKDRCQKMPMGADRRTCEENRAYAHERARRLDVGSGVCLEGDVLEEPSDECTARGVIVDVGADRALLEVRGARSGSRWYEQVQTQSWYTETALVDLYLSQRGF